MREQTPFDVAIIGSGPGGYVAAIRAAQLGLRAAIVEKDTRYGGTCLLRGCIPTKALLHDAHMLDKIRNAAKHGFKVGELAVDFGKVQDRKDHIVAKLAKGVEFLLRRNKIMSFKGHGSLVTPNRILVKGGDASTEVNAKSIVIATGSEPKSLPGYDIDGQFIITNNEALALSTIPKSMFIVGAGAVGVEFASIYASFGTKVTLIDILPNIVPLEDEEVSKELRRSFEKQGIEVHTSAKLGSAKVKGESVQVTFQTQKGEAKTYTVDKLLMATGRAPNTANIGLEKLGVRTNGSFIKVDEYMETSVPGIYAVGDAVPTAMLAHLASHEGILAVEKIAGTNPVTIQYNHIPSCTYCEPQVASIGLTEARAREAGFKVKTGKFPFSALGKAMIENATEGFIKVVADEKYGEILGVHMVGGTVTELIAEAVAAMSLEATADDLIHTVHAHPTLAEALHEAVENIYNAAIHI